MVHADRARNRRAHPMWNYNRAARTHACKDERELKALKSCAFFKRIHWGKNLRLCGNKCQHHVYHVYGRLRGDVLWWAESIWIYLSFTHIYVSTYTEIYLFITTTRKIEQKAHITKQKRKQSHKHFAFVWKKKPRRFCNYTWV